MCRFRVYVIISSVFFTSCGIDPAKNSRQFQLVDQALDVKTIDELIVKREAAALLRLQNSVYHKNMPLSELLLLARVGKARRESFIEQLGRDTSDAKTQGDILFQQYRRIWYLADAAYHPIDIVKFRPLTQLIPYLNLSIPHQELSWLLPFFEAELKKERQDLRALGHECSEILKLQTIVDGIKQAISQRA